MAQPVNVSPPIAVADATVFDVSFSQARSGCNVAIVFYDTAAAEPGDEIAAGTGSRDITVQAETRGEPADKDNATSLVIELDDGTLVAADARTWYPVAFGNTLLRGIRITSVQDVDPGGAVSYRIWVK